MTDIITSIQQNFIVRFTNEKGKIFTEKINLTDEHVGQLVYDPLFKVFYELLSVSEHGFGVKIKTSDDIMELNENKHLNKAVGLELVILMDIPYMIEKQLNLMNAKDGNPVQINIGLNKNIEL